MAAGLPASPSSTPSRLVPLHALLNCLADMADKHGADFGARIVAPDALMRMGAPARAVSGSRTIREALIRIASTFYQHTSVMFLFANQRAGGMEVVETVSMKASAKVHHQVQIHVAALISSIGHLSVGRPLPARMWISPHPDMGIAHLKPCLGDDIVAEEGRTLRIWIEDEILDHEFPWAANVLERCELESQNSAARSSLTESAYILILGMIADGNVSLDRLAFCSGRSRRSLQRMLAAEGTSFASLLDAARQDQVLGHLIDTHASVSSIGNGAGFRSASSVTRAVRRWTDASPRQIRGGLGFAEHRGSGAVLDRSPQAVWCSQVN